MFSYLFDTYPPLSFYDSRNRLIAYLAVSKRFEIRRNILDVFSISENRERLQQDGHDVQ